jgi:hypothetical protein
MIEKIYSKQLQYYQNTGKLKVHYKHKIAVKDTQYPFSLREKNLYSVIHNNRKEIGAGNTRRVV